MLVLGGDELLPRLFRVAAENAVKVRVEFQVVRVQVVKEFFGAEKLGNLDQLVVIVVAVKEWLLAEDHAGKHTPQTPHVEAVIVLLQIDEEFRSLEVAGGDAHIVFSSGMIELGQAVIEMIHSKARREETRSDKIMLAYSITMADEHETKATVKRTPNQ
jgi:hypothetical protein